MRFARLLLSLAVLSLAGACRWFAPAKSKTNVPIAALEPLAPSPRLIVGRIVAVDLQQQFAIVELAADAPMTTDGLEFSTRTMDLRPTGRLRASRYLRSRTLGTTILEGQPAPGDEVVWLAP
jgi:hypothetical protein